MNQGGRGNPIYAQVIEHGADVVKENYRDVVIMIVA